MPPVSVIVPAVPAANGPSRTTPWTAGSQSDQVPGSLHSAHTAAGVALEVTLRACSKVTP